MYADAPTQMFNWAADRGLIVANPLAGVQRPELGYVSRERVLTVEEVRQIQDVAGKAEQRGPDTHGAQAPGRAWRAHAD
ncbi:hypothetical protein DVR09_05540 [Erythrobacter aureus]|uniref:Uncharacterized protein n=1 Tax=Erythrobacter aureus TaxID=2182384 RepID=A0A345YD75_9SPHN|nr:hypothetical protein DVR09_05540 [Erythrobacter aureus]